MLSFRNIRSEDDVVDYVDRLNRKWPERRDVIRQIYEQIKALPFLQPHIVELCSGPGQLAEFLLKELPLITYTGLDLSTPLMSFARRRLAPFGNRAVLIQANLNADDWLAQMPENIHAIVSMQSLHDLGGEEQVSRIYRLAQSLLAPGGLFLNADLVVSPQQDASPNSGRRSISRHLELLQTQGYRRVSCPLQLGEFGCIVGFKPR